MDIQDLTPAGGGSLRGAQPAAAREPVATFTPTQTVHPDEIWHPWGGELDSRAPLSSADDQGDITQQDTTQQRDTRPGRPGGGTDAGYSFESTARTVRSALRPG